MAGLLASMNATGEQLQTELIAQQVRTLQVLHTTANGPLGLSAGTLNGYHARARRATSSMASLVTRMAAGKHLAAEGTTGMRWEPRIEFRVFLLPTVAIVLGGNRFKPFPAALACPTSVHRRDRLFILDGFHDLRLDTHLGPGSDTFQVIVCITLGTLPDGILMPNG